LEDPPQLLRLLNPRLKASLLPRRKRKLLLLHLLPRKKKKIWIWETSSDDREHYLNK
jgi:hypothetical protein